MNELEIVKSLFKAYSNHEMVSVREVSGRVHTGEISFFDGNLVQIENEKIELALIDSIGVPSSFAELRPKEPLSDEYFQKYADYKFSYQDIIVKTESGTDIINGFVFDVNKAQMVLLTEKEKKVIDLNAILEIKSMASEIQETVLKSSEETGFEKALLAADIEKVKQYCASPEMLSAEGYSVDEVNFIIRSANASIPWSDTEEIREYNQARRIYTLERNRNNLAEHLFEQVVNKKTAPKKRISQAILALIEIYKGSSERLNSLYNENETDILSNSILRQYMVDALVFTGDYSRARSLVDESSVAPENASIMMSLAYYEKRPQDVTALLNIDAFDPEIGYKELRSIVSLPEKASIVQLLSFFNRKDRTADFFSLLELVMPYARNDVQIVEIVKKCLSKDTESRYIAKWLPEFPTLWLDKQLCEKFAISDYGAKKTDTIGHLLEQCRRAGIYADANELEDAVIRSNYEVYDVLRNNSGILMAMGYSADEISTIKSIDKDSLQSECKTVFERLIRLEGNRNHVPESLAGNDYLHNPEKVGGILFPILIQDDYAGLVYELFNYSPYITSKLTSLRDFYLQALLILGKKDEYWDEIKDNWLQMNLSADFLKAGHEVAKAKGDYPTANAMEIMANGSTLNEIEKALVSGNIPRLRTYVMDASYLSENGYSEAEISLLQENFKRRVDFSSHDSLSIAKKYMGDGSAA